MKIDRERLYRVEGCEMDETNEPFIENITLLVNASSIEKACFSARSYFGMGVTLKITKCELVQCG